MSAFKVGHTTITWVPYFEPERAVHEIAGLGFQGVETFGAVLEEYARNRGGFGRVLEKAGIPLASAYLFSPLIDPSTAGADVEKNLEWARLTRDLGGRVVVIGATDRQKDRYSVGEYRGMARTLDEIGRRCLEIGVTACFHPHTGTPVEMREEIDMLMELVDPEAVFFAPDTGQIQKGGSDALEVLRTYADRVRHVHLKDFIGGEVVFDDDGVEVDRSGFLNYVPLGDGVVDLPATIELLEAAGFDGWINVELDGNEASPCDARAAAARSKQYLEGLLGAPITPNQERSHAARLD